MTGRSLRRTLAVATCLTGLLCACLAQAHSGPPVKIHGNYAIIDEVYFAVLDLPRRAKADGSTARLVERQILNFLRRSGYLLATVKAGVVINGMRTAVTGQLKGAGMFEILEILGRQRVVDRLRRVVQFFT